MTSCLLFSSLVNQMNLEMLRVKTHQSLLESDTFDRGAFSFFKVAVAHMMLAKACVPVVAGDKNQVECTLRARLVAGILPVKQK